MPVFLGVELALAGFGPVTIAAGRVSVAALILVSCALAFGDGLPGFATPVERRIWLHCFGMGLFTNALPFSLLSWGQQTVTSGFAGISMAVVPLLVLPLSHFLVPGETMNRVKTTGFLFGFGGVVLLVGGDELFSQTTTTGSVGGALEWAQIACVVASCCYAIGSIITRLCPPISTLSYAAAGLLLGGAMLVPVALLTDGLPLQAPVKAMAGLAYLAIFPTAIATIFNCADPAGRTTVSVASQLSGAYLGGDYWRSDLGRSTTRPFPVSTRYHLGRFIFITNQNKSYNGPPEFLR